MSLLREAAPVTKDAASCFWWWVLPVTIAVSSLVKHRLHTKASSPARWLS